MPTEVRTSDTMAVRDVARVDLRARRVMLLAAAVLLAVVWLAAPRSALAASPSCPNGSTMDIVAHQDDTLLFLSPDLLHNIQSGQCVRTVFVTAGNNGEDQGYWSSREQGAEASYAQMAGVANTWTQSDAGISGHPMPLMTLSGDPRVSLVFIRLPDGNIDGSGFPLNNFESLQKLWLGEIPHMTTVDGSSSYTRLGLINTLTALMSGFAPDAVNTQDYAGTYGDGDHSDHHTVAYMVRDASRAYTAATHTLTGYMDYLTQSQASNVTGTDLTQKKNAWFTYTPFDPNVCQTAAACQQNSYWSWLNAQYTVGTETDGPNNPYPPTADAGASETANVGAPVQLDASRSFDPQGSPTYQWTQTGGPAVTLSSATSANPSFTAPSAPTTLTFRLVVSDGPLSSQPAMVSVAVTPGTSNVAPLATVTASSQDKADGQPATNAVNGVLGGEPDNPTAEWATNGGKAKSWLKLVWTAPQTINDVVLYDRPDSDDQVLAGTLTFSDGSTVAVPALNNDGSPVTITFPAVTTTSVLFTVSKVSSTTQNVGLSEIQVYPQLNTTGAPVANAGPSQAVNPGATAQLDGTGSVDPAGNPSYAWTQTGGTPVTLSSATAAQPTFTVPSAPGYLTFQLVVTDGQLTSQASTVTVTVSSPNIAPLAKVTASSQDDGDGEQATKAVDGVIGGYPLNPTVEWATNGGKVNSWIKLVWTTAQTISRVVLYDRPNLDDQVLAGTLTFSDGTTVTVPALNNDGSAVTVTFPAKSTTSLQFKVTKVSSTTQNVGLAEIQTYAF